MHTLIPYLFGTISIAALHALIPSHWLAFAVVGRSQKWSTRRTLAVTLTAGLGHILITVVLGFAVAGVGKALNRAIPPALEHLATSILLIALGLYFAVPALLGKRPHQHDDLTPDAEALPNGTAGRIGQTPTVMGLLIVGMTLSPCLDLISVYVAASALSWTALAAISLTMAATTLSIMALLVWLTLRGLEHLHFHWLEQNEGLVIGGILIALGILLFFV